MHAYFVLSRNHFLLLSGCLSIIINIVVRHINVSLHVILPTIDSNVLYDHHFCEWVWSKIILAYNDEICFFVAKAIRICMFYKPNITCNFHPHSINCVYTHTRCTSADNTVRCLVAVHFKMNSKQVYTMHDARHFSLRFAMKTKPVETAFTVTHFLL